MQNFRMKTMSFQMQQIASTNVYFVIEIWLFQVW
jgi:hypothetical protein